MGTFRGRPNVVRQDTITKGGGEPHKEITKHPDGAVGQNVLKGVGTGTKFLIGNSNGGVRRHNPITCHFPQNPTFLIPK